MVNLEISAFPLQIISEESPAVLIFMTINTEVLPVRAIRRVVIMIPILMVHSEKVPVFEIKLSPAFGTDQAVDLQGLFPVIGVSDGPIF